MIEVQSKIYGFRVDSLHSDTFSLLGGMLRQNDNFQSEQQQNVQEEDRTYVSQEGMGTLEKDVKKINFQGLEMGFEIDPLFQKTSSQFDETGNTGLLLNTIRVDEKQHLQLGTYHNNDKIEEEEDDGQLYTSMKDLGMKNGKRWAERRISDRLSAFRQEMLESAATLFTIKKD